MIIFVEWDVTPLRARSLMSLDVVCCCSTALFVMAMSLLYYPGHRLILLLWIGLFMKPISSSLADSSADDLSSLVVCTVLAWQLHTTTYKDLFDVTLRTLMLIVVESMFSCQDRKWCHQSRRR